MHTNVLKRAGVKAERGAALLIPGTLSEWVVFVNVHDVVTDKKDSSVVGGVFLSHVGRQRRAQLCLPWQQTAFLKLKWPFPLHLQKKKKKNIEYFKLH